MLNKDVVHPKMKRYGVMRDADHDHLYVAHLQPSGKSSHRLARLLTRIQERRESNIARIQWRAGLYVSALARMPPPLISRAPFQTNVATGRGEHSCHVPGHHRGQTRCRRH